MVKIFLSLSREHLSLAMQGHAGAGENGSDLVCAACSILAHTLFKMVADAAKKGMLYAAKVMAGSAIDAFEDPAIIQRAKAELNRRKGGRPFVSPIPEGINPRVQ